MPDTKPYEESERIEEFSNITAGEYSCAKDWFLDVLRKSEQGRVLAALREIKGLELVVDGRRIPLTTIVAGSSVYPGEIPMIQVPCAVGAKSTLWQADRAKIQEHRGHYKNINLFLLLENHEHTLKVGESVTKPEEGIEHLLVARGHSLPEVPEHVFYVKEPGDKKFIFYFNMCSAEVAYDADVRCGLVPVKVSLLKHSLLRARGAGDPNSLVPLPRYAAIDFPPVEQFIEYNQRMGSKFLVLNRQETLPEK